jgi:hypothetical protein
MEESQEERVEQLARKLKGRFKLTTLIQKQMREYHLGGRAFMPNVRNVNELFEYILTQIENGEIRLELRETAEPEKLLEGAPLPPSRGGP